MTISPRSGRPSADLVAFTALGRPAVRTLSARPCHAGDCFEASIDFAALDREPPYRDEDGWTVRPVLKALGRQTVAFEVGSAGLIDRLTLVVPAGAMDGRRVPVEVAARLSAHGDVAPVDYVRRDALE